MTITLRPISNTDLNAILHIQDLAYRPEYKEIPESISAKMLLSDTYGALAIDENGEVCGYLFAYLLPHDYVSPLNAIVLPRTQLDSLYIQDMVIHPDYQGKGIAQKMYQFALERALESNIKMSTLVAVGGADSYWVRLGYIPVENLSQENKKSLETYGPQAIYMHRKLS